MKYGKFPGWRRNGKAFQEGFCSMESVGRLVSQIVSQLMWLVRPRWWEDNIKMNLEEVGWQGMEWIIVAQDRGKWEPEELLAT